MSEAQTSKQKCAEELREKELAQARMSAQNREINDWLAEFAHEQMSARMDGLSPFGAFTRKEAMEEETQFASIEELSQVTTDWYKRKYDRGDVSEHKKKMFDWLADDYSDKNPFDENTFYDDELPYDEHGPANGTDVSGEKVIKNLKQNKRLFEEAPKPSLDLRAFDRDIVEKKPKALFEMNSSTEWVAMDSAIDAVVATREATKRALLAFKCEMGGVVPATSSGLNVDISTLAPVSTSSESLALEQHYADERVKWWSEASAGDILAVFAKKRLPADYCHSEDYLKRNQIQVEVKYCFSGKCLQQIARMCEYLQSAPRGYVRLPQLMCFEGVFEMRIIRAVVVAVIRQSDVLEVRVFGEYIDDDNGGRKALLASVVDATSAAPAKMEAAVTAFVAECVGECVGGMVDSSGAIAGRCLGCGKQMEVVWSKSKMKAMKKV